MIVSAFVSEFVIGNRLFLLCVHGALVIFTPLHTHTLLVFGIRTGYHLLQHTHRVNRV